jgi:hypothetical protein
MGGGFQASHEAQQGGFATARGADQGEEFALAHVQIHCLQRGQGLARVGLLEPLDADECGRGVHRVCSQGKARRCMTRRA